MGVRQINNIFFSRRCGQARMRLFASTVAYFVSPAERLLRRNKPSGSGACDGGGPPENVSRPSGVLRGRQLIPAHSARQWLALRL